MGTSCSQPETYQARTGPSQSVHGYRRHEASNGCARPRAPTARRVADEPGRSTADTRSVGPRLRVIDIARGKVRAACDAFDVCERARRGALSSIDQAGRLQLRVVWDKYKAPKSAHALASPQKRAHLLHTFLHHELQAAELMCWAVLKFRDTPPSFRRGLLSICQDEIRHMRLYSDQIERLGFKVGDFPVRDWFWSALLVRRAPSSSWR